MGEGPDSALAAEGTRLHIDRRALVSFRAPDHPEHAAARGPLVKGWATFTYLGPDATRAGVHLARIGSGSPGNPGSVVYFSADEARWIDEPVQPPPSGAGPSS